MFEEGAYLILARWTALALAVEQQWGGARSKEKAQQLYDDVIAWFYDSKGMLLFDIPHYILLFIVLQCTVVVCPFGVLWMVVAG